MFRIGEKVICVDDGINKAISACLVLNKIYTISKVSYSDNTCKIEEKQFIRFSRNRFKSLNQIRKEKIEKICLRLETE
jgi:hypothetical protein